ncbi:DUF4817 domain-containing protein [Trichonephila clavipes]|nr:DUF4817 domain-containing protein [Trichonephila clavipes]
MEAQEIHRCKGLQVRLSLAVALSTIQELWFQQDGATCHTVRATIDLLKDTFGDRLISRFGPVNWPPRFCDLTPLHSFLWGYVKSLVYADKPQTLDHLEDNIRRVIADIRPQMLEKVIENWKSRLDYIRGSRGSHMPRIIFKIRLSPSVHYKRRAQKPQSLHFTQRHGTRISLHPASCHVPQEADLGDYITFMMNFRGVLIRLKPSEVIELETVYAVNIIDVMMEILPYHDPHDVPWFESFSYFEPADLDSEFMEQEAAKGKGAFVQALWTQYAIPKLYFLVYKAWRRYGAQNLTTWTRLAQAVLDGCFGHKWPDCVFQVPDSCSICLSTMHWPETTQCGHAFHLRCLLRHLDVSNTCPLCRTPDPLRAS